METMETKEKAEKTVVKSTRARPSSISKFDQLAEDFGLTQADLYDICVNAGQAVLLKNKIPGRGDEIDALETALKQIRALYFSSIEMAILAKSNAEKDLKLELDTQTRTIADLQGKQDELKERIKTLEQGLDAATAENNRLQVEVNKLNEVIVDKEALIQSLKNSAAAADVAASVEELKKVVASMNSMKKEPEKE